MNKINNIIEQYKLKKEENKPINIIPDIDKCQNKCKLEKTNKIFNRYYLFSLKININMV